MTHHDNIKVSVGIDIAKKNHHATILLIQGSERKILQQFFFSNTSQGFSKFLKSLKTHLPNGFQLNEVKIALEATAHYYIVLSRWLSHHGLNLIVCNPRQSKYLRNVLKPYFKTDPIDSQVLAIGADLDLLKGELYSQEAAHLKELLQLRKKISHDLVRLKNQVTRLVDLIFPERDQVIKDLFSKTSLKVLEIAPTPSQLLQLGQTELGLLMIRSSYNRLNLKHTKKLLHLARNTIGIEDPIWIYELQVLLPRLINLKSQMKEVEQNVSTYTTSHFGLEKELLITLPGVKTLAASAIIGFLGDLRRFDGGRSGRKVTAFAGLAVMQHSSGQKERHWSISKAGPSLLRFYLHFAALTAIRTDGPFMEFYIRLVNRGTPKLKALVAVAAKILRTAYCMLRDQTEFNPQMVYPQNHKQKSKKLLVESN